MSSVNSADLATSVGTAAARQRRGPPPVLVVGLGNPLLGDDGVGWRVVAGVEERLGDASGVEFDQLAVGGLTLMERLVGFERVILVDALLTGRDAPGTVSCSSLGDLSTREASHLDNAHDAPLPVALAAGRALGAELPDEIAVVGIEARRIDVFDEELTPEVAAAIPVAVDAVLDLLAPIAPPT